MPRRPKIHFNWRLVLVHTLANAIALGVTVLLLPGVRFLAARPILGLLASGFIFGVLNAFVRPVLQFLTFRFLFVTYGLVLVLINVVLLWILDWITPGWFEVNGLVSLILAGIIVGLVGIVAEVLLGLRPPVLESQQPSAAVREHTFRLAEELVSGQHGAATVAAAASESAVAALPEPPTIPGVSDSVSAPTVEITTPEVRQ